MACFIQNLQNGITQDNSNREYVEKITQSVFLKFKCSQMCVNYDRFTRQQNYVYDVVKGIILPWIYLYCIKEAEIIYPILIFFTQLH